MTQREVCRDRNTPEFRHNRRPQKNEKNIKTENLLFDGIHKVSKGKIHNRTRWNEYIGEHYHDNGLEKPINIKQRGTCRIKSALAKTNRNKALDVDADVIEMLSAISDFEIDNVTEMIHDMTATKYRKITLDRVS